MPRVSRRTIDRELQDELEDQLSFIISSLTDKNEISVFLNEFFTREEKIMFGKRIVLYEMLIKGMEGKDICAALSMSNETIRSYKQLYLTKPSIFQKTVERLIKREKNKELWNKIDKILAPLDLAMRARNDMKARAKLANGDWFEDEH